MDEMVEKQISSFLENSSKIKITYTVSDSVKVVIGIFLTFGEIHVCLPNDKCLIQTTCNVLGYDKFNVQNCRDLLEIPLDNIIFVENYKESFD